MQSHPKMKSLICHNLYILLLPLSLSNDWSWPILFLRGIWDECGWMYYQYYLVSKPGYSWERIVRIPMTEADWVSQVSLSRQHLSDLAWNLKLWPHEHEVSTLLVFLNPKLLFISASTFISSFLNSHWQGLFHKILNLEALEKDVSCQKNCVACEVARSVQT